MDRKEEINCDHIDGSHELGERMIQLWNKKYSTIKRKIKEFAIMKEKLFPEGILSSKTFDANESTEY